QMLKYLKEKTEEFSKAYDDDANNILDIDELIAKKDKFEQELNNGKLNKIIEAIKKLENEIISYRQGFSKKEEDKKEKKQQGEDELDIFLIDIIRDDESKGQTESATDDNSSS